MHHKLFCVETIKTTKKNVIIINESVNYATMILNIPIESNNIDDILIDQVKYLYVWV